MIHNVKKHVLNPILLAISAVIIGTSLASSLAFADESIDVKITGMTCQSCKEAVEKQLKALDFVDKSSITVELEAKRAIIKVANNDKTTQAAIKAAVEEAGYEVAAIEPHKADSKTTKKN